MFKGVWFCNNREHAAVSWVKRGEEQEAAGAKVCGQGVLGNWVPQGSPKYHWRPGDVGTNDGENT